jgi:hypothetical protein
MSLVLPVVRSCLLLSLVLLAAPASAQPPRAAAAGLETPALRPPPREAPAPTLESRVDRPLEPWTAHALTVDAVGLVFGAYDLRIDLGLARFVGVALMPGWRRRDGLHGPSFGVALEAWPLGRGLDGLALGIEAQVAWLPADPDRGLFSVAGYAGYRHVWRGIVAGIGVGVRHERGIGDASQGLARRLSPLVSVWLGWGLDA